MTDKDPSGTESNVEGTIKAVTGLVKEVPVYEDAIQPVAKETGKVLQTVGRTVNAALLPVRGLVWGIEQIEEFVHSKVSKKLESTPVENICTPDPAVAGPALESLRYTGHKESLSELYANLLASAMDKETAKTAHPGFVEIIRNMSSDEAKLLEYIMKNQVVPLVDIKRVLPKNQGEVKVHELVSTLGHDAGLEHKDLSSSYLVNLERLGLIEIPRDGHLTKPDVYDRLINDPPVQAVIEQLNNSGEEVKGDFNKYYARGTVFGRQFSQACVINREKT
ncbi:DUF4393 domain-containing protein [Colwellia sp. 1_MG-2023]|uniref:DUF4393 domain-containing protein n=1 Tax=unclassified Colwellia TaxID=196834 RepID=UPI001C0A2CFE|nr:MULTISPECIES: DUF4393 domain-containing protein [unclassified Colwellia]MBU2923356.1 DUF4393 domain-containing protein [Colwellia sp. C2M11]MDO6654233.1 DUF4393 domain-containing protein [Colwellia sp. 3_MG-2023]MDO6667249.1 DUF4393 domain-containing protein [Colwellia sp. 2_MG-2023]MDO6691602.1 DUF4393 domain-containing protein [Colwellia sp. 1_MG-2023]